MAENVTIRHVGDNPIPVLGKLMLPGETRPVHPAQAKQLQDTYRGWFEISGGSKPDEQPEPEAAEVDDVEVIDATDPAAALAEEHGLNLAEVEGTGAGGRITKGDVEKALAEAG